MPHSNLKFSTSTMPTFHTKEEDHVSSPLLPLTTPSQPPKSFLIITLATFLLVSLISAATFFVVYGASNVPPSNALLTPKPPNKLKKPVVILISCDGFRFGYQFKTQTPNIHRLIKQGTEAELGLIPVYPTLTFPNHYSIVTGLYPPYHGIISNGFTDPATGEVFTKQSRDPKWWLGEPLWATVVNQGLKASTYFWPGSEVHKGKWDCPKGFCMPFNTSVPFEERVDTVLSYFDLPENEIPSLMTIYFQDPDSQGHKFGPDDPQITQAIARVDQMIGRLISGLEERRIFNNVNIILLGDHGMVGTCDKKLVFLSDLRNYIDISEEWVEFYSPLFGLRPTTNISLTEVVDKIRQGLSSGEVENGEYLKVYLKEDLPSRLQYSDSDRIPPIIGMLDEGYKLEQERSTAQECGGAHGYDNELFSMRSIFIGHGPRFWRGRKVPSFKNVEIYNLVTKILNIGGAPNNGTASFWRSILAPFR